MSLVKKHTIHLKARRIDNGYIVTGHVENKVGTASFPETFVPTLALLDMAVSERLSGAQVIADGIKAPEGTVYSPFRIMWGGGSSDDDGDGE